jgi:hypothetical protein
VRVNATKVQFWDGQGAGWILGIGMRERSYHGRGNVNGECLWTLINDRR